MQAKKVSDAAATAAYKAQDNRVIKAMLKHGALHSTTASSFNAASASCTAAFTDSKRRWPQKVNNSLFEPPCPLGLIILEN